MKKIKPTTLIRNLFFGLGIVAASPLSSQANTFITTQNAITDAFLVSPSPGDLFVPVIFSAVGGSASAEQGFYHQAILLQKSTEQYFQSIMFDFEVQNNGDVYIYKETGFKY